MLRSVNNKHSKFTWLQHVQSHFHGLFSACVVTVVLILRGHTQVSGLADCQETFPKRGSDTCSCEYTSRVWATLTPRCKNNCNVLWCSLSHIVTVGSRDFGAAEGLNLVWAIGVRFPDWSTEYLPLEIKLGIYQLGLTFTITHFTSLNVCY